MDALALRRHYQKACPHVLYGVDCRALKSAHEFAIALGGFYVSGASVTVASLVSHAANYFAGGFITYTNAINGAPELRAIRSSAAGVLSLSYVPAGIAGVTDLKIYPGCNHTSSACTTKFNNLANYGGQLYIPSINPFNGAILY